MAEPMQTRDAAEWRELIASLWDLSPAETDEVLSAIEAQMRQEVRHG